MLYKKYISNYIVFFVYIVLFVFFLFWSLFDFIVIVDNDDVKKYKCKYNVVYM